MCVHVCNFTSGGIKTCLCLETCPGSGTQFSILSNCYHSPGTFLAPWPASTIPDKPQAWLRVCMEQTPLPMGSLDVATLCDLKICLDHPKPAGLGGGERVQTCAFSLIQTQSLSKLARVTAKICGKRVNGGVHDPCYRLSVPSVGWPSISSPQFTWSFGERLGLFHFQGQTSFFILS